MDFFGKNFDKVVSLPFYMAISSGGVEGFDTIDKFGEFPNMDVDDSPSDIWEQGGLYTFSNDGVADINTLSSSNTLDTGIRIQVIWLSQDWSEQIGYAWLNGQNKVLIYANSDLSGDTISFWRVHRLVNVSGIIPSTVAKSIVGDVYCYVDTAITGGVPTDVTKIRAKIINWNNQTQMAIYTIPKGKVGYLIQGDVSISRPQSSTGTAIAQYFSRRYGGVFTIKKTIGLTTTGTSYFKDVRTIPDIIPPLTDLLIRSKEVTANGTWISASFQIILIDDPRFW